MNFMTVRRMIEAEGRAQADVQQRTLRAVAAEVSRFRGWYDAAALRGLAARLGGSVRSGARGSAALTDAYLARVVSEMTDGSSKPSGTLALDAPLRRGVTDYSEVYARLGETYRFHESRGMASQAAIQEALTRADSMVRTDLALARRQQARDTLRENRVTTYRRVIHPELSESGACGLCAVASTRVYYVSDLMPIHDRCVCTVSPRIGEDDPGSRLNDEDLEALYEAAGSTGAADLKRTRVRVEDHNELGPRLGVEGHRAKGGAKPDRPPPGPLPKGDPRRWDSPEMGPRQLTIHERKVTELEARTAAGEDVASALAFNRDRRDRLRALGYEPA